MSETCKRLLNKSWMTLMVSFQILMTILPNSRASGPILLVLFLASPLGSQNPLLMVMLCESWLVSLRLITILETPKIVRFSKRLWTFWLTLTVQGTLIRRLWTLGPISNRLKIQDQTKALFAFSVQPISMELMTSTLSNCLRRSLNLCKFKLLLSEMQRVNFCSKKISRDVC